MENHEEFRIITLDEIKDKEKFWYGNVKFKRLRPAKDNPNLIYCEFEDCKNSFVFISKATHVDREL